MPGYVYILTNEVMPGLVKIGKTTRDPYTRAREISGTTGVPKPFEVAHYVYVSDCDQVEQIAHSQLWRYRVNNRREFFQISLADAKKALDQIADPFVIDISEAEAWRIKNQNKQLAWGFGALIGTFLLPNLICFFFICVCPILMMFLGIILDSVN